ncbi:MAG: hypothetical protein JRF40_00545, partial [Deltaproteobacteria bacterium]|nr:hypothetical protein [Deltaproteobacteria bacterium]
LWERGLKKESPDEIAICINMTKSYDRMGDSKMSEKYNQKTNEFRERISNILFPQTGSTLGDMSTVSRYQKKMQEIIVS